MNQPIVKANGGGSWLTFLGQQTLLNVTLDPSQQKGSQDLVQLLHHRLLIRSLPLEPFVKGLGAAEDVWQEKVEQRPQLVQVVLKRRAGDQEPIPRLEQPDDLREGGLLVLNSMSLVERASASEDCISRGGARGPTYLIDDDVLPREFLEVRLLSKHHLVARDADVEFLVDEPISDQLSALLLGTLKHQHVDLGSPLLELPLPVVQRRLGHRDEMRPGHVADVAQIAEESNRLQRLPEAHLVGQDARNTILVQRYQPVQPGNLIVSHLAVLHERWRVPEGGLGRAALLSVLEELVVLLLLGAPKTIAGRATGAFSSFLELFGIFAVLSVDLCDDVLNTRVRTELDKMAEQVC